MKKYLLIGLTILGILPLSGCFFRPYPYDGGYDHHYGSGNDGSYDRTGSHGDNHHDEDDNHDSRYYNR